MSFSDFWTNNNNPSLPKSEYLYGTRHIIVLVVVALLAIALSLIFYKRSKRVKEILLYVFGGIFIFFEISSRVVNLIVADEYSAWKIFEILLPGHICSVMVWVFIVAIFTKKQFLYDFGAIGGILATVAFLAFPAVGLNKVYMTFTCLYSVISHMVGFVCSVCLITLGIAKFPIKKCWQPLVCFAVMFGWGALLNFVIFPGNDLNYMYLIQDPLELNLNFPYHILYAILFIAYTFIYYGVYALVQCFKKKRC